MPQATTRTQCTAQRNDGSFCERLTVPGAPFPICVNHLGKVAAFLTSVAPDMMGAVRLAARPFTQEEVDAVYDRRMARRYESVVYYVKVAGMVKIGYTRQLQQRLRAYPPTAELLATEPGDQDLEAKRLVQFRLFRVQGREWFRPSPELTAHINTLRETPLTFADLAA